MLIHWFLFAFNVHIFKECRAESRTLTEILRYFETLNKVDITHHVVRRSINNINDTNHVRHVNFHSHEIDFQLELIPSNGIFSPNFEAVAIDSHGNEESVFVAKEDFYTGFVKGEDNSSVTAHIEHGMITASVTTSNDTFYIEPMSRHVEENNNASHDMIVYRVTDMNWNLTHINSSAKIRQPTTCDVNSTRKYIVKDGLLEEHGSFEIPSYYEEEVPVKHSRKRRNIVTIKNMCDLVLVCDHFFYKKMGSLKSAAVNYMLQVASRVNAIYIKTDWPGLGKGIGFQVKKVIIHKSVSDQLGPRYNQKVDGVWNVDQLLTEFSRTDWKKYCLAHLFTHQDFARGVIGLAYVASPSLSEVGGICTGKYRDVVGDRFLNCGLASNVNWGRPLLTLEAELVTAHELGHNVGSNHDPSSCSSNSADGRYIMYATSVAGDKPNNNRFSICSRNAIASALKTKRLLCFSESQKSFCGNGKVEEGEKCDTGLDDENDPCCNSQCQLRPGMVCSDSNSPCCQKCVYAAHTTVCRPKFEYDCRDKTKCSGYSAECPNITNYLSGGEDCGLSKGKCINGKDCSPLCEIKNKESCLCGAGNDACKVCCKDKKSGSCKPLLSGGNENDGIPCFLEDQEQGYCIKGKCEKAQQNVKGLLNDFSFSKFARFMEENIVGTILVFSLLVWIPAGCIVHYLDKKQDEEHEEMKHWLNPFNRELIQKATPAKLKMLFQRRNAPEQKLPRTQYHISS